MTEKTTTCEPRVLYTIRLEPRTISKIEAMALKFGKTHAAVARDLLTIGVSVKGKGKK